MDVFTSTCEASYGSKGSRVTSNHRAVWDGVGLVEENSPILACNAIFRSKVCCRVRSRTRTSGIKPSHSFNHFKYDRVVSRAQSSAYHLTYVLQCRYKYKGNHLHRIQHIRMPDDPDIQRRDLKLKKALLGQEWSTILYPASKSGHKIKWRNI